MAIWFDVEDLLLYYQYASRPTGIQRLSFEIYREIARLGAEIKFCRRDGADGFRSLDFSTVEAGILAAAAAPAARPSVLPALRDRLAGYGRALPLHYRMPAGEIWRGFGQMASGAKNLAKAGATQATGQAKRRAEIGGARLNLAGAAAEFAPGDWLVNLGASWHTPYEPSLLARLRAQRVRLALLVYDLIPTLFPEWTARGTATIYETWLKDIVPAADLAFAISQSTAADLAHCVAARGRAVPPIAVLPLGSGPAPPPAPEPAQPSTPYVLIVSTVEVRKNHILAFRIWRRLLREMPAADVPDLVFAGKPGWLTQDLFQQLDNAGWLDGKIRLVASPSEPELAALYRGCRFTLFPSLYEGWGLPVSESLSYGKTVAASNAAAIPEAGGDFCVYFNPDNLDDAYATVAALISEPGRVAALEAKIAAAFRPPSWADTAAALLARLRSEA